MLKNPKAAGYVSGMYGGWVGLGVSAHLTRIYGGNAGEIVLSGVLGYFGAGGFDFGMRSGTQPIGGWVADHGIAGRTMGIGPDVSDQDRVRIDRDLITANAFLVPRYYSSEADAVRELHRVAGAVSADYGVELYARIFRIAGSRGRVFFSVGQVTTSYAAGTVLSTDQARSVSGYSGRRRVRYVANWHTHPGEWSNDFSDRFSNTSGGDISGYTQAGVAQNGYVSLLHRDAILKFDWGRWQSANGGYSPTQTDRFKCSIRGKHSLYPACP